MKQYRLTGYTVFTIFNNLFLFVSGFICILPLIHMFAVSLSSPGAANANEVGLWPVGFNVLAYKMP